MRRSFQVPLLLCAALVALAVAGCGGKARCTAEVADGTATYTGAADGKKGQPNLDREARRDACRQKCAAEKAVMPDACAARCVVDIDAQKIGARVRCTDR